MDNQNAKIIAVASGTISPQTPHTQQSSRVDACRDHESHRLPDHVREEGGLSVGFPAAVDLNEPNIRKPHHFDIPKLTAV